MAVLSNDEILSIFKVTEPLPTRQVEDMPTAFQKAGTEKFKRKQKEMEIKQKEEKLRSDRQKSIRPNKLSSFEASQVHTKLMRRKDLIRYSENSEYNFDDDNRDSDDEEFDEALNVPFGPAGRTNPNAHPGDDDYEVSTSNPFANFSFDVDHNPQLPIEEYRDEIVRVIEANPVTLIQGETGSGKSTQVAQYILNHYASSLRHCNIVCTQPRRIAATSIAKYVSHNRGWELGSLVGYQIGMDKMVSEDTRLTFVTTGVLLEKLVNMKNMNQFTHIILDEIHERDKDTDFCMLVVRKLLRTNSKNVKVILMSATIDPYAYTRYFTVKTVPGVKPAPAPAITVQGRTYRVIDFCLDDIKHVGECEPMVLEAPVIREDVYDLAAKLIKYFDTVEQQEPGYSLGDFMRGTVLVFLPGLPEIRQMQEVLNGHYTTPLRLNVLLLHSSISSDEQSKVFLKPELGKRKVILATNIAESSITVPDIKYVIDFCLVKQLSCDWETNFCTLRTEWASLASLTQRQGRAGRVSNGRCYRLISREFLSKHILSYSIPEMQRCPLESIVLKAKKLNLGEPKKILSYALQPPNLGDIERAILNLKEVGAITVRHHGLVDPYDGQMTFVGQIMESLPIDVKLSKLILLGHAFGCLHYCLVIAAALSLKSFFVTPSYETLRGYRSKMAWDDQTRSFSDCIAIINAYEAWFRVKDRWRFKPDSRMEEMSWCKRNLISIIGINQVAELVKELTARLARFNIKPLRRLMQRGRFDGGPEDIHELLILKVVLCGAFYPNYFRWSSMDEELNQKTMSGHDPTTTVMVSALPVNAEQYAADICRLFEDCGRGKKLHFEGQKVFVEFERQRLAVPSSTDVAQPVQEAVYLALKKRHERNSFFLYTKEDPSNRSNRRRRQLAKGKGAWHGGSEGAESASLNSDGTGGGVVRSIPSVELPDHGTHHIIITEVVNAGEFWAQFSHTPDCLALIRLQESILSRPLEPLVMDPKQLPGVYCLAMFLEDSRYYRARVESVMKESGTMGPMMMAQVVFIDYGNMQWVPIDSLCKLSPEDTHLPAQAFECVLAHVKPAYSIHSKGCWSQEAKQRFEELCLHQHLIISIYSKVNNILRVELSNRNFGFDLLINDLLVEEEFADKCEEQYQSKLCRARAMASREARAHPSEQGEGEKARRLQNAVVTVDWISRPGRGPSHHSHTRKVMLRGPNNPYEVTFYSLTNAGKHRPVRIERLSVNSIVVDNEPQDHHERLMIAAHVQLNPSGNACIARDTTLLPNIHGLPFLVSILFAPSIEMRTDDLNRQYIGVLCGLGSDPSTGESIYHEHDMELTFDTHITNEDLANINDIRRLVNTAVGTEDSSLVEWAESAVKKIQAKAREKLKELVLKPRDSVSICNSHKQGWNQIDPVDMIRIGDPDEVEGGGYPSPYPMHMGINISGQRIDKMRSTRVLLLREKMKELRLQASDSTETEYIVCELCNIQVTSPFELKQHLYSTSHRSNEEQLHSDDLSLDKDLQEKASGKLA